MVLTGMVRFMVYVVSISNANSLGLSVSFLMPNISMPKTRPLASVSKKTTDKLTQSSG